MSPDSVRCPLGGETIPWWRTTGLEEENFRQREEQEQRLRGENMLGALMGRGGGWAVRLECSELGQTGSRGSGDMVGHVGFCASLSGVWL